MKTMFDEKNNEPTEEQKQRGITREGIVLIKSSIRYVSQEDVAKLYELLQTNGVLGIIMVMIAIAEKQDCLGARDVLVKCFEDIAEDSAMAASVLLSELNMTAGEYRAEQQKQAMVESILEKALARINERPDA